MSESTSIFRRFPRSFWVANAMEIFERMGWYGFFAVSSLYLTGAVAEGGLGFSSEERGVIQGLATFFLYLFPIFTGALADRFGYNSEDAFRRAFKRILGVSPSAYRRTVAAGAAWRTFGLSTRRPWLGPSPVPRSRSFPP